MASVDKDFVPSGQVADILRSTRSLSSMSYTNCNTRIINLQEIDIPDCATDADYRCIHSAYVETSSPNAVLLRDAVESIRHGIAPPVAFPTETVYGLGADASSSASVAGIFAAKGRPSDNPLIVHAASATHLEQLTGEPVPEIYRSLVAKYWPGPLTILLPVPKASRFADNVHPGQKTIGFRVPKSKYARFFIAATDRPIAGPSANSSGKPSPTTSQHVLDDLQGKINFILDGGPCQVGVESTVVDGLHDPPLILRPGGVSREELIQHGKQFNNSWQNTAIGYKQHDKGEESSITNSQYYVELNGAPRAPGMKYRHYAPMGRLVLFSSKAVSMGAPQRYLANALKHRKGKLARLGVISCHWPAFAKTSAALEFDTGDREQHIIADSAYRDLVSTAVYKAGDDVYCQMFDVHVGKDMGLLAHSLFGILRLFDDLQCDLIFAESITRKGEVQQERETSVFDALSDRLGKAAAETVHE